MKYKDDLDSKPENTANTNDKDKKSDSTVPPTGQKVYNPLIDVEPIVFLKGHKYGVEALRFSPDSKYLISLGDTNDKGLFVWDW